MMNGFGNICLLIILVVANPSVPKVVTTASMSTTLGLLGIRSAAVRPVSVHSVCCTIAVSTAFGVGPKKSISWTTITMPISGSQGVLVSTSVKVSTPVCVTLFSLSHCIYLSLFFAIFGHVIYRIIDILGFWRIGLFMSRGPLHQDDARVVFTC